LQELNLEATDVDVDFIFDNSDKDGTGTISREEIRLTLAQWAEYAGSADYKGQTKKSSACAVL
jgi:Ca2+-binding EF-hand superfamily protein